MRSHNNHSPLNLMKATLKGSSNFSRNSDNFTVAFFFVRLKNSVFGIFMKIN